MIDAMSISASPTRNGSTSMSLSLVSRSMTSRAMAGMSLG